MGFTAISAAIIDNIQYLQQDGANAFAAVYNYPTIESAAGTPFATVVPSDSPSDYLTNVQNIRDYTFFIDIYYPINADDEGYQIAFTNMSILIDTVLDAIDNSGSLNATAQIVKPSPSNWSMTQSSMGTLLDGRIVVVARLSTPQSNG